MAVIDLLKGESRTAFSFEVLPPLKGTGMRGLYQTIDTLREFNPLYINITTHRNEVYFRELGDGIYERYFQRRRPGTVAVASAIHSHYGIPTVPHLVCSGHSREDIESILFDLQYLGITDLLILRGDKAKDESRFKPVPHGWSHALEMEEQVNDFNRGVFVDGTQAKSDMPPFHYGVAGYPEKHEEAPNMEQDLYWLRRKVDAGAEYVVTQLFYDNQKFFHFVERAREIGIEVPIIPGIKPFTKLTQLTQLPKTFGVDLPQELATEVMKCKTDADARQLGVEWSIAQCRELIEHGVPSIHFYSMGATESIQAIARSIY